MRIQYEEGDEITLRRVTDMDASDWGLDEDEYAALKAAQRDCQVFTIECEAVEGYYDISSEDYRFVGVSSYHFVPNIPYSLETMLDL